MYGRRHKDRDIKYLFVVNFYDGHSIETWAQSAEEADWKAIQERIKYSKEQGVLVNTRVINVRNTGTRQSY